MQSSERDDGALTRWQQLKRLRSKESGYFEGRINKIVGLNNNKCKRGVKEDSKDFGLTKENMEMPSN